MFHHPTHRLQKLRCRSGCCNDLRERKNKLYTRTVRDRLRAHPSSGLTSTSGPGPQPVETGCSVSTRQRNLHSEHKSKPCTSARSTRNTNAGSVGPIGLSGPGSAVNAHSSAGLEPRAPRQGTTIQNPYNAPRDATSRNCRAPSGPRRRTAVDVSETTLLRSRRAKPKSVMRRCLPPREARP